MDQMIYTFGYEKRTLLELRDAAESLDAIVIDVRLVPHSRAGDWNRGSLEYILPDRYLSVRDFGNEHYQRVDLPFRIRDLESGIAYIEPILRMGRSIILLCYEHDPGTCHRSLIASILSERFGIPVAHLFKHGIQLPLF